jgi:hypothetical protein
MKSVTTGRGRARIARTGATLAVGLLAALATVAEGQEGLRSGESLHTRCGWSWRVLGIGGIQCSGCSFRFEEGRILDANFDTEPEVTEVAEGLARGDRVRTGDRIVAVDGELIATSAGVERLLGIRAGREVRLTVRRDGRARDLRVVAGDACETLPEPPALARAPEPSRPVSGAEPAPPEPSSQPSLPPVPSGELPPAARLGFGFSCSECGIERGTWFFGSSPRVTGVERSGPAWTAGIRVGDEIVQIDGRSITSDEGGERFSAIEPGQRIRWSVQRDGQQRTFEMTAGERTRAGAPPAPNARATPSAGIAGASGLTDELRYQGRIGDVDVEVRGAPVTVTVVEESGEVIIRTSDTVVRLRREGAGG